MIPENSLYLNSVDNENRGLFCYNEIKQGDIIIKGKENLNFKRYSLDKDPDLFAKDLDIIMLWDGSLVGKISETKKRFVDFINHSLNPNAAFDNGFNLFSLKNISPLTEITIDYRVYTHPYDCMWEKRFMSF